MSRILPQGRVVLAGQHRRVRRRHPIALKNIRISTDEQSHQESSVDRTEKIIRTLIRLRLASGRCQSSRETTLRQHRRSRRNTAATDTATGRGAARALPQRRAPAGWRLQRRRIERSAARDLYPMFPARGPSARVVAAGHRRQTGRSRGVRLLDLPERDEVGPVAMENWRADRHRPRR